MKFFSLFFFILSSFFAIADIPVPEQDKQYLQQEEDENGYGCVLWKTVDQIQRNQQSDGTWRSQQLERFCEYYCRPPQSGDEQKIIVYCYIDFPMISSS